jgi:hypothetical protein
MLLLASTLVRRSRSLAKTQRSPSLVLTSAAGNVGFRRPVEGRSEMGSTGPDTQTLGVLGDFARDSFQRIGETNAICVQLRDASSAASYLQYASGSSTIPLSLMPNRSHKGRRVRDRLRRSLRARYRFSRGLPRQEPNRKHRVRNNPSPGVRAASRPYLSRLSHRSFASSCLSIF